MILPIYIAILSPQKAGSDDPSDPPLYFETFMGVVQRTGAGSKPRISRVVSKSDRALERGYYGK